MLAHTIQTDDSLTAELGILAVDPFIEGFNSAIDATTTNRNLASRFFIIRGICFISPSSNVCRSLMDDKFAKSKYNNTK